MRFEYNTGRKTHALLLRIIEYINQHLLWCYIFNCFTIKCDCRVKEISIANWVNTYFFSWRCRLCFLCRSWLVEGPKCTVGRLELYFCISVTAVSPKMVGHSQYFIIFFTASVKSICESPTKNLASCFLQPSYSAFWQFA